MVNRYLFQRLGAKIVLCLVMVVAADWLFYDQPLGWTVGLYGGLVLGALLLTQRHLLRPLLAKIVFVISLTLIAHMIDAPDKLSAILFVQSLATLLILNKREKIADGFQCLRDTLRLIQRCFSQWFSDQLAFTKIGHLKGFKSGNILRYAVLPVIMTLIFSILFAEANPIIADVLGKIDFSFLGSPLRWMFWIATTMFMWGLMRPKFQLSSKKMNSLSRRNLNFDLWLNKNSIVLSLFVFNVLFAIQNILDITFLWGGQELPNGMSYATYAHEGAYPLIVTAILAAIYVLITFGENSERYQTSAARVGVYAWVGQNIFLVISAVSRTLGYIESYSLTYLRIAALIWMVLVAAGLTLIIVRIYARKSNIWLTNANTLTLMSILYICCFVNFDRIIADYNIHHTKELISNYTGTYLDVSYLQELGPDAIPALRWFLQQPNTPVNAAQMAVSRLEADLKNSTDENWRSWTWHKERLKNELDIH